MSLEGAVGLLAGFRSGSVSLVGWALSSVVEGLASVIVIWRLTGTRTLSAASERAAQRAVAVSVLAARPLRGRAGRPGPGVGSPPFGGLAGDRPHGQQHPGYAGAGPGQAPPWGPARFGRDRRRGHPNLLCAYLAAAVLVGLVANTAVGAWWLDPLIALAVAAVAVKEGRGA